MKKNIYKILIIILIFQIIFLSKIIINKLIEYKIRQDEYKSIEYILDKKIGTSSKIDDLIKYEIIIEIPKINLKKGILKKDDKDNHIDKNVTILKESNYPNEKGNIYIAAHSGNGSKSYFNDLVKLEEKDNVYLYYQNLKYKYEVTKISYIDKNKYSSIITTNQKNLFLITCSQVYKNKYLVIILQEVEKQNF